MLYDQMRFKDRMFIVMTLLGESLADIKRKRPDRVFRSVKSKFPVHPSSPQISICSLNTGLYCAIQCLTGIELLHKLGFVHRDIKPANFVVGRRYESNQNVVGFFV
jgi:serine/threonine protein kinase